jgi:tetratricopeptide (TPR) repeat protein
MLSAIRYLFAAAALVLLPLRAEAACDPHGPDLGRAKALIDMQKLDAAAAIVSRVLKHDPADFHAKYLNAAIIADQADIADKPTPQTNSRFPEALSLLEQAADTLPQMDQACAKKKNFYEILNTIGAELLDRGRFKEAEIYLLRAKAAMDGGFLDPATAVKVLDNLGLVYLWEENYDLSGQYYRQAQTHGSPVAAFQLGTVQKLRRLAPAAKKPASRVR